MTRDRGIMWIFRQNRHFLKVLVVWGARVQALVVWGGHLKKKVVVWEAKLYFSLVNMLLLTNYCYIYIFKIQ
jgi:hypothetical protein